MTTRRKVQIEVEAIVEKAKKDLDALGKSTAASAKAAGEADKKYSGMGARLGKLEKEFERTSRGIQRVTQFLGAAGLVGAAVGAVKQFDALAQSSFKYQAVMANLPFDLQAATKATGGLVDKYTLAKSAATAARLGVTKSSKEFARLAEVATKLGLSVGQDAAKSVEDLSTALARQSPMILDNLGISLKLSEAYDKYAKRIGKTAAELTDAEKKQAFMTEAMRLGEEAAGKVTIKVDETTRAWMEMRVQLEDLGREVLPVLMQGVADLAQEFKDAADEASVSMLKFEKLVTDFRNFGGADMLSLITGTDYTIEARSLERKGAEDPDLFAQAGGRGSEVSIPTGGAPMASGPPKPKEKKRKHKGGAYRSPLRVVAGLDFDDDAFAEADKLNEGIKARMERDKEMFAQLAHDRVMAEAEAELNARLRRADMMEANGVDPIKVLEAEQAARLAHMDFLLEQDMTDAERLAVKDQREQVFHEGRLRRMEIERKKEFERRKAFEGNLKAINAATQLGSNVAGLAAEAFVRGEDRKAKAQAATAAVVAGINAALETARAIAAVARYDFGAAAGHAAAAVAFTTAAVVAGRNAAGAGGAAPDALTGGSFGFGAGGGPANGRPTSTPDRPEIPRSSREGTPVMPQGAQAGPSVNVWNLGELDEDSKNKLARDVSEAMARGAA